MDYHIEKLLHGRIRSIMKLIGFICCFMVVGCFTLKSNPENIARELSEKYMASLIMEGIKISDLNESQYDEIKQSFTRQLEIVIMSHFSSEELIELYALFTTEEFVQVFTDKAKCGELDRKQMQFLMECYTKSSALRKFVSKDFIKKVSRDVLQKTLEEYIQK